jgi:hypothetical protein
MQGNNNDAASVCRARWPNGKSPGAGNDFLWHDPAHLLVGIFASRQPKPFGEFLTQSGHAGVAQSSTTRPSAGHE